MQPKRKTTSTHAQSASVQHWQCGILVSNVDAFSLVCPDEAVEDYFILALEREHYYEQPQCTIMVYVGSCQPPMLRHSFISRIDI